jgi:hypothetical protein
MFMMVLTVLAIGGVLYMMYRALAMVAIMCLLIPRLAYIFWCQAVGTTPKPWWPFIPKDTNVDPVVATDLPAELE